jgi:hypothetical protein
MQRTSLFSLVLVGLVAVAGCNAFSSGSNTPMVTPMDVPTDTPPPTVAPADSRLPQQCSPIQQIGFENAAALAAAHNATVWNTSFSVRLVRTGVYQNGSLAFHRVTTAHIGPNHSRVYVRWEKAGTHAPLPFIGSKPHPLQYKAVALWTNGERVVRRYVSGHTAQYNTRSLTDGERGRFPAMARSLATEPHEILANATVCVTDRFSRNGTTLYRLAFTRTDLAGQHPNATVLRPVAGRAFVDASGIIHELRLDYVWHPTDDRGRATESVVTVTETITVTGVGSTSVERPLWYETAVTQPQPTNRTAAAG